MNGVGTWYYGKSNLFSYTDFCPYCNRYVTLSSYDTREWFVVLFIPIIPLRKKRIIDSCPVCTKHKQLSLKQYLQHKEEAYSRADQKFQDHPNDPEAACELLQVFAAYQDMSFFDETVGQILELFPDNHKLLTTVGSIQLQYGRIEQARDYLRQSLALDDDDQVRHMLGFVYTRLADPDKAADCFQFILQKQDREKAGSLFALVDSYQAHGRHEEALVCLDNMARVNPDLAQNKAYLKSRKLSEKYQASGKPIKNKQMPAAHSAKTPLSGKKTWGIAALVGLAILLVYGGASFFMGLRSSVFLVNGLSRPYEIELNGRSYSLPKYGYQKIAIAEGNIELKVLDEAMQIPASVLSMRSSFWGRPFLERVYVINPDAVALIEWTKAYYNENPNAAPDPEWQFYFGKQLHVFDHIHFPFKAFPEQITISQGGSESRVQINLFDKSSISPSRMPDMIEHFFGIESKIEYLRKILYCEPDQEVHLANLLASADIDTCLETIRPGLDRIPPYVEWHRYYQNLMETKDPAYDLAAEYKSRLDKVPENAELQYLYGRSLHEDGPAKIWFNKSIQGPNPSAYGCFALGYDAMTVADYPTALAYYEKALRLKPENPNFCRFFNEMLVAANQLDKAADFCRERVGQEPLDYTWMQEYVSLLRQLGRQTEASNVFNQWCGQNKENFAEEDFNLLRRSDQINAAYQAGDFAALEQIIGEPNDINDKVLLTLNRRRPIPDDLLAQADAFPPEWLLLFYISESQLKNQENAELFLKEAVKRLEKGDYRDRCVCDCLKADPQAMQSVYDISLENEFKATVLTALGVRFPEHRQRFFALARRLNYKMVFPYHFLNAVLSDYAIENQTVTSADKQI